MPLLLSPGCSWWSTRSIIQCRLRTVHSLGLDLRYLRCFVGKKGLACIGLESSCYLRLISCILCAERRSFHALPLLGDLHSVGATNSSKSVIFLGSLELAQCTLFSSIVSSVTLDLASIAL